MTTTDVVTANTSFSAGTRSVTKGETFRASDPLVHGREECFDPFKVDNEIEQATAAPGEKRSKRPRAKRTEKETEKPAGGQKTSEADADGQQATAAPGEKRVAERTPNNTTAANSTD